jgi:hypothetical protein
MSSTAIPFTRNGTLSTLYVPFFAASTHRVSTDTGGQSSSIGRLKAILRRSGRSVMATAIDCPSRDYNRDIAAAAHGAAGAAPRTSEGRGDDRSEDARTRPLAPGRGRGREVPPAGPAARAADRVRAGDRGGDQDDGQQAGAGRVLRGGCGDRGAGVPGVLAAASESCRATPSPHSCTCSTPSSPKTASRPSPTASADRQAISPAVSRWRHRRVPRHT